MRFTLKDDEYWVKSDNQNDAFQKLGKLEDILEKYNIDTNEELETLCKYAEYVKHWMSIYEEKMLKLNAIEEELGIDLKVYHKLMDMLYCGEPNILYVKDKDVIIQVGILEIDYCKKKIIFYKDKNYNDDYVYGFSCYGKTWALTKEELL